jgi:hypothetical protein
MKKKAKIQMKYFGIFIIIDGGKTMVGIVN